MPHESEPAPDTQIYARFVFSQERQALEFARLVSDHEGKVNVSYSSERARWQATVRQQMQPLFRDVTGWLTMLTARAAKVSGERDGWGKSGQ
jgi:hypothetical protein